MKNPFEDLVDVLQGKSANQDKIVRDFFILLFGKKMIEQAEDLDVDIPTPVQEGEIVVGKLRSYELCMSKLANQVTKLFLDEEYARAQPIEVILHSAKILLGMREVFWGVIHKDRKEAWGRQTGIRGEAGNLLVILPNL